MATTLRILVLLSLGCLIFQMLYYGSRVKASALGTPPIARPAFVLAKLSMILSLCLLFLRAAQGGVELPAVLVVLFLCLLVGGSVIFSLAFPRLGASLRMGIPKEDTVLVTSGMYGFTRNPLYLALFSLLGASLIYAFSWINVAAVAISVILHHRIVLAEEKYLAGRFTEYEAYRKRVGRYL